MEEIVDRLIGRLKEPLPGHFAHRKMMPFDYQNLTVRPKPNASSKQAAVLILFHRNNGVISFPLILRNKYPGAHSGQMSLPGGGHELGDKDLIYTAVRETEEEIGVQRSEINVLGSLSEIWVSASGFMVLPVVGFTESPVVFVPEPKEVQAIYQFSIDHLLDENTIKSTEVETFKGSTLRTPYFNLEGQVVWGATAMILSELKEILR